MTFHPTGSSFKVSLSSAIPQSADISNIVGESKCVRLMAVTWPTASKLLVALGSEDVTVNSGNGMPIDLSASKEYFLGVTDETHIAMMMVANNAFEIMVTPGENI